MVAATTCRRKSRLLFFFFRFYFPLFSNGFFYSAARDLQLFVFLVSWVLARNVCYIRLDLWH